MPGVFGNKRKEKEKLITNLAQIFQELFEKACIQVKKYPLNSTSYVTKFWQILLCIIIACLIFDFHKKIQAQLTIN